MRSDWEVTPDERDTTLLGVGTAAMLMSLGVLAFQGMQWLYSGDATQSALLLVGLLAPLGMAATWIGRQPMARSLEGAPWALGE